MTSSFMRIPYNFEPRPYQLPFLQAMDSGYDRAICVWHRRSGKDKTFLNFMVARMLERVGSYYYFLPTYKQGRLILWEGADAAGFPFMDHIPKAIRRHVRNDEMKIEIVNGSVFRIVGTDQVDAIMGTNPIGCVFSEYSLQNPQAWDYIRPIIRENKGWAVFNGTPRGRNHLFKLLNDNQDNNAWYISILTVDNTTNNDGKPAISKDDVQAEREAGMDEALVQQEFYCSFDAMLELCFFGDSLTRHKKTTTGVTGWLVKSKGGEIVFREGNKGILEIWRYPYIYNQDYDDLPWSKRYVIGTDISEGLGRDYSVAYVYDRITHEIIARMRSNKIDSVEWARQLYRLSQYFDNALIVPERNGAGITVCKQLRQMKANLYVNTVSAKVGSGLTKVVGWQSSKQAKFDICGDLREYFISTKARVYCKHLLSEGATFIKTELGERLEAEEGFHDDCVIAAALAIHGHFWQSLPEKAKKPLTGWRRRFQDKGKSNWAL